MKATYYTVLRKTPRFFSVGKQGWEIHIDENGKAMTFPGMPMEAKRDLRLKMSREKRLAQAVNNEQAYNNLLKRIDTEDWEFIEKNDLKGDALICWAYNTPTSKEFENSFKFG